jgi:hypothetical protein
VEARRTISPATIHVMYFSEDIKAESGRRPVAEQAKGGS